MAKYPGEPLYSDEDRATLDPCYAYTPGPTALRFHQSASYYNLVTGGNRSGKTACGAIDIAWRVRGIHPFQPWDGPVHVVWYSITRKQSSLVAQKKLLEQSEIAGPNVDPRVRFHPMIPPDEIADIRAQKSHGFYTVYTCDLVNGSKITFAWSDMVDAWKHLQGGEPDIVVFDEAAGTVKLLAEAYSRLPSRQSGGSWRGRINWHATGTEINPAFERFRRAAVDPEEENHTLFQIARGENPAIDQEALDRFNNVLTEAERKVRFTGEETAAGLVLIYGKQWDDNRHMLPVDYEPTEKDMLVVGYDPGVDHPTGMVVCALRPPPHPPQQLIVCQGWEHANETIEYDILLLKEWLRGRRIAAFVYDRMFKRRTKFSGAQTLLGAWQEEVTKQGMAQPIQGYFLAEMMHRIGIPIVRAYLDPDEQDKTALPLILVNPSDESGGQRLRYEFHSYRGKEETMFTGAGGLVKKDDDMLDALRYVVGRRFAYHPSFACGKARWEKDAPPAGIAAADVTSEPAWNSSGEELRKAFQIGIRRRDRRRFGAGRTQF